MFLKSYEITELKAMKFRFGGKKINQFDKSQYSSAFRNSGLCKP